MYKKIIKHVIERTPAEPFDCVSLKVLYVLEVV